MKNKLVENLKQRLSEIKTKYPDGGNINKNKRGFLEEKEFRREYEKYSELTGNSPNPYDIEHFYDYSKLFDETGGILPHLSNDNHLPSEYKELGHPNLFINGINTKKFPDGGSLPKPDDKKREPIYVDDLKDPRLQMFNDSLDLYNLSKKQAEFLKSTTSSKDYNAEYAYNKEWNTKINKPWTNLKKLNGINPNPENIGNPVFLDDGIIVQPWQYKKPVQPVIYKKPEIPKESFNELPMIPTPDLSTVIKPELRTVPKQKAFIQQTQATPYRPMNYQINLGNKTGWKNVSESELDLYDLQYPDGTKFKKQEFKFGGRIKYPNGGRIYANKQGVVMGPVESTVNGQQGYTVPQNQEGLPVINFPEMEITPDSSRPTYASPGRYGKDLVKGVLYGIGDFLFPTSEYQPQLNPWNPIKVIKDPETGEEFEIPNYFEASGRIEPTELPIEIGSGILKKPLKKGIKNLSKEIDNILPEYKNIYRVEPTDFKKDPLDELSGRWFSESKDDPLFYSKNLKSKNPDAQVRLLTKKINTKKLNNYIGDSMPEKAKRMSIGTGNYKNIDDLDLEISNYGFDPFTIENFQQSLKTKTNLLSDKDIIKLSNNPRLFNYQEAILDELDVDKIRNLNKNNFFSSNKKYEFSKDEVYDNLSKIYEKQDKNILGIPRNKLPFKYGGTMKKKYNMGGNISSSIANPIAGSLADKYNLDMDFIQQEASNPLNILFGIPGAILGGFTGPEGGMQGRWNALQTNKLNKRLGSSDNIAYNNNSNISFAFGGEMLNEFSGPNHEEGGTHIREDVEVEGGETQLDDYIFSDRLKPENSKKTFAQISKMIKNKYSKRENDTISNKAQERELNVLKNNQEAIKEIIDEFTNQMAYGGKIKYPDGGKVRHNLLGHRITEEETVDEWGDKWKTKEKYKYRNGFTRNKTWVNGKLVDNTTIFGEPSLRNPDKPILNIDETEFNNQPKNYGYGGKMKKKYVLGGDLDNDPLKTYPVEITGDKYINPMVPKGVPNLSVNLLQQKPQSIPFESEKDIRARYSNLFENSEEDPSNPDYLTEAARWGQPLIKGATLAHIMNRFRKRDTRLPMIESPELIDTTIANRLANNEADRALNTASYGIRQSGNQAGSVMGNLRSLGIKGAETKGVTSAKIQQDADMANVSTKNQWKQLRQQIAERDKIGQLQDEAAELQTLWGGISDITKDTASGVQSKNKEKMYEGFLEALDSSDYKMEKVNGKWTIVPKK